MLGLANVVGRLKLYEATSVKFSFSSSIKMNSHSLILRISLHASKKKVRKGNFYIVRRLEIHKIPGNLLNSSDCRSWEEKNKLAFQIVTIFVVYTFPVTVFCCANFMESVDSENPHTRIITWNHFRCSHCLYLLSPTVTTAPFILQTGIKLFCLNSSVD